jgi:hypothetical protein
MSRDNQEQCAAFLREYEALCQKYGLFVEACGCCDSPWIEEADEGERAEHIAHLREQAGLDDWATETTARAP